MHICVFLSAADLDVRYTTPAREFARDLADRKAQLLARADALVVLAGGLGTLDEATEILELRKHGHHSKPVVLLNTAGFYDGLVMQLRRMESDGFLPVPLDELIHVTDDGADVLDYLQRRQFVQDHPRDAGRLSP
ncbi:LOG family protein [Mycobacterium sp. NPDC003323]